MNFSLCFLVKWIFITMVDIETSVAFSWAIRFIATIANRLAQTRIRTFCFNHIFFWWGFDHYFCCRNRLFVIVNRIETKNHWIFVLVVCLIDLSNDKNRLSSLIQCTAWKLFSTHSQCHYFSIQVFHSQMDSPHLLVRRPRFYFIKLY